MKTNKKTFKHWLTVKYLVVFVAGLAVSLFVAYAATTTISTNLTQAVQYIQKIVLTNNGGANGATGVVLDWSGARILTTTVCELNGANCKLISEITTGAGAVWATGANGINW